MQAKMENLEIEETQYTPKIMMDAEAGVISISGNSYPENSFQFYEPVIVWLKKYLESHAKEKTIVNFEIIYFNSSSSMTFFNLLDLLDKTKEEHPVEVNWIFDEENENIEEAGEDLLSDFDDLNFNLVIKNDE